MTAVDLGQLEFFVRGNSGCFRAGVRGMDDQLCGIALV